MESENAIKKSKTPPESAQRDFERLKIEYQEEIDRWKTKTKVTERLSQRKIEESNTELQQKVQELRKIKIAVENLLEDLYLEKKEVEKKVKEKTAELQEERAEFIASVNSLSLGFVLIDKNTNIILKNWAVLNILKLPEKDFTLEKISAIFGGSFDFKNRCAECLAKGLIITQKDIPFLNRFLRVFMASVTMSRDHNEIIGVVILIEDITEAKIQERSRDEFFAVASHELRTPLTAIRGNAQMIQQFYADKLNDPELKNIIQDIYQASIRLIEIVNDFLDVSRIEQGKITLKKEPFELPALIEKVLKDLSTTASAKNVVLKFNSPVNQIPLAFADTGRIEQILVNLVGNAIKFTSNGDVEISVSSEEKGFLKIKVRDMGIGILPQNQTLLFRKFQQAGEQMLARDVTQGTGLGLYISRLVVESMGGVIGLEKSELGKGSTFYFTVPVFHDSMNA